MKLEIYLRLILLSVLFAGCNFGASLPDSGKVTAEVGSALEKDSRNLPTATGGPAAGVHDSRLETAAIIFGTAMPTGVAVSRSGRVFLSFPRWGDKVESTVMELSEGKLIPYPDADTTAFVPNQPKKYEPQSHFVSVQSVVVDDKDRLWVLDPGSINLGPVIDGAAKLWAYDLSSGQRVKQIDFPNDIVMKRTYLNDVRFDLSRGEEGLAYITDSGVGGIIVVDLASGKSWRHLDSDASVRAIPGILQHSEGEPLLQRQSSGEIASPDIRSDGIALSPDGATLYFSVVAGRDIFAVPTALLADPATPPDRVSAAVRKISSKESGNDGIICDRDGYIYTTDFEDGAIRKIDPASGRNLVIVRDERLLWPDTLAIHDNELYFTSNQLARQPNFHFGKDERKPPYALFRLHLEFDSPREQRASFAGPSQDAK